ncbi:MAG: hypothetical protein HY927_11290 [Elusimicrobia bacterium]|nr:hypothetical protein [Elusimicrobiota bacterium]
MRAAAGERGTTFLEVSIAMLLVAVVAGSVFSIALTTRRSSGRSMRRLAADQAALQLNQRLKSFITQDTNTGVSVLNLTGPGSGASTWSLDDAVVDDRGDSFVPGAGCTGGGVCNNCYALSLGTHCVRGILPLWLSGPPFNASIRYVVKHVANASNFTLDKTSVPVVEVYVDWTEPQNY